MVPNDLIISFTTGLVIAFSIIYAIPKNSGRKTNEATEPNKEGANNSTIETTDSVQSEISPEMNDAIDAKADEIMEKLKTSPHLQKFFGISQEKMDKAIEMTKQDLVAEARREKAQASNGSSSSMSNNIEDEDLEDGSPVLWLLIYTIAAIVLLYITNILTGGTIFEVLVGFFPVEARALKLI
jgi:hypothetical protein